MTNTKDIIIRLKEVRKERGLSYGDILDLMEQNGDFVAKSTLSKLFADGSEDHPEKFRQRRYPMSDKLHVHRARAL